MYSIFIRNCTYTVKSYPKRSYMRYDNKYLKLCCMLFVKQISLWQWITNIICIIFYLYSKIYIIIKNNYKRYKAIQLFASFFNYNLSQQQFKVRTWFTVTLSKYLIILIENRQRIIIFYCVYFLRKTRFKIKTSVSFHSDIMVLHNELKCSTLSLEIQVF